MAAGCASQTVPSGLSSQAGPTEPAQVVEIAPPTVAPEPTPEPTLEPTPALAPVPVVPSASPTFPPPTAPIPPPGGFAPGLAGLKVPDGHGQSVSLTFDDGPSARFTPQILALLNQAHAPATFCMIGRQVAALAVLVQQEIAAGDLLCDHSRDHDLQMRRRGVAYETSEVNDGLRAIQAVAPGVPVLFYRQPGGLWDPNVLQAAAQAGLAPLRWTDDPRDWSRPGTVMIAQRILAQLRPGGVVLMHDGGGDRTETVEALTWLLRALPAANWTFTLPTAEQAARSG